jgi:hypothetical protein
VFGQLAFGSAALGRRRAALHWACRAAGRRPLEPRTYLALAVAAGLASPEAIMSFLHRRGRGL